MGWVKLAYEGGHRLHTWSADQGAVPPLNFNLMELLCQEESDSLIKTQLTVGHK